MTFVGLLLFFFKLRKQNWFTKECMRKNAGNIHKANVLVWHTGKEEDTVLGCYQLAKGTWHFWCCCTRSEFIWCADWHLLLQCYIIVVPQKFLLLCCGDGFKVVTLCWAFWWPHKSKGGIIHKSCHSFSQWRLKGTRHLHVANMFCVNAGEGYITINLWNWMFDQHSNTFFTGHRNISQMRNYRAKNSSVLALFNRKDYFRAWWSFNGAQEYVIILSGFIGNGSKGEAKNFFNCTRNSLSYFVLEDDEESCPFFFAAPLIVYLLAPF